MNRQFLTATLVVFVLWMAGSFAVHHALLHEDYAALAPLFRRGPAALARFHLMIVAHALMAGAFVWIYARGAEAKPWFGQGLRYGLAVALLAVVPAHLIRYVVQPLPGAMVVRQIVLDSVLVLILAAVVAFLGRGRSSS